MTEAAFQAIVVDLARLHGWLVAHFRPGRTAHGWRTAVEADGAGFVDLVLVRRERVVWAELKGDGGSLTAPQKAWLQALEAAGQEVYAWYPDDWDEVCQVLGGGRAA